MTTGEPTTEQLTSAVGGNGNITSNKENKVDVTSMDPLHTVDAVIDFEPFSSVQDFRKKQIRNVQKGPRLDEGKGLKPTLTLPSAMKFKLIAQEERF